MQPQLLFKKTIVLKAKHPGKQLAKNFIFKMVQY